MSMSIRCRHQATLFCIIIKCRFETDDPARTDVVETHQYRPCVWRKPQGSSLDTFSLLLVTVSRPGSGNFDTITNFTHNSDHIDFAAANGLNSNNRTVIFSSLTSTLTTIAARTIDIGAREAIPTFISIQTGRRKIRQCRHGDPSDGRRQCYVIEFRSPS